MGLPGHWDEYKVDVQGTKIFDVDGGKATSLVAQTVKHLPTMRETWVRSLGWEDPWRRKWQPTPVSLPGESHGRRSLVGYSLQGSQRVGHDWATSLSLSLICTWLLEKPALTMQTFVGKVMSLLFNTLSSFVIAFLPRSRCLLISWLQSPSTVTLQPKKRFVTVSPFLHLFATKWWDQMPWS